jgi:hypothetical protein
MSLQLPGNIFLVMSPCCLFLQDALLDEEGGRAEGGFDAGSNAVTFKVTAAKASAMTAEEAHEVPSVAPVFILSSSSNQMSFGCVGVDVGTRNCGHTCWGT